MSYFLDKQYKEAVKEFVKLKEPQEAVGTNAKPTESDFKIAATFLIGQSYLAEKKMTLARSEFNAIVVTQNPQNEVMIKLYKEQAQLAIAESYIREQNYKQAKIEYDKVLAIPNLSARSKAEAEKQLKAIADLEKPDTAKAKS